MAIRGCREKVQESEKKTGLLAAELEGLTQQDTELASRMEATTVFLKERQDAAFAEEEYHRIFAAAAKMDGSAEGMERKAGSVSKKSGNQK